MSVYLYVVSILAFSYIAYILFKIYYFKSLILGIILVISVPLIILIAIFHSKIKQNIKINSYIWYILITYVIIIVQLSTFIFNKIDPVILKCGYVLSSNKNTELNLIPGRKYFRLYFCVSKNKKVPFYSFIPIETKRKVKYLILIDNKSKMLYDFKKYK